jgi:hypothetical protein
VSNKNELIYEIIRKKKSFEKLKKIEELVKFLDNFVSIDDHFGKELELKYRNNPTSYDIMGLIEKNLGSFKIKKFNFTFTNYLENPSNLKYFSKLINSFLQSVMLNKINK